MELIFAGQVMDSIDFASVGAGETKRSTLEFTLPSVVAGDHEIRILAKRKYAQTSYVQQFLDNISLSGGAIPQ